MWARRNGLLMHLDGARLWNAIVATGIKASEWAKHFDTVSVCFSKGLGAPIGSALAGPKAIIAKARRQRKLFGGGMRQAGIVAAGALYALDHHIERLADDHRNAKIIGQAIADTPGLTLTPSKVDTNLVWFRIDPAAGNAKDITAQLKQAGILVHAVGPQKIRICTHLDVTQAQAERVAETLRKVVK
jgi:threonine aldolase